jgi:hypothetical protein
MATSGDTVTNDKGSYFPKEVVSEWTINPKQALTVIKEIGAAASQAFKMFDGEPLKFLDEQATAVQNSFGLTKQRMGEFKNLIADTVPELAKMGISQDQALKTTTEAMEAMGTAASIGQEAIVDLAATNKLTGVSVKLLAENFREVGVSIYDVSDQMKEVVNYAKSVGVSVSGVAGKVSGSIKQMNLFNFENGVEGLTKMAVQSQRLGVDMSKTFALAEKLMSPEKAIEMSSALQRLGVTSSQLLDPLRAMDLAQNDPEELQNQMVELSKQFTKFNEETGKMEIMPGGKRRLREIAKELDLGADEFASMSIKAADFDRKLSQLKLPDFASENKETKELIASMAQIKDGVATINIKDEKTGEVLLKQVDQLTPEDIESLKVSQEEKAKSVEELAYDQLTQLEQINSGINGVRSAAALGRATSAPVEKLFKAAMDSQKIVSKEAADRFTTKGVRSDVSSLTQKFEDYITKGIAGDEAGQKVAMEEFGKNLVALEEKMITSSQKYFEDVVSKIGQNFKQAYEAPKETKSTVDFNIKSEVKVNGDENTKDLSAESWDRIWNQKLNDPVWLENFKRISGGSNQPSATVGAKIP